MKRITFFVVLWITFSNYGFAQNVNRVKKTGMLNKMVRKEIRIPNIPGFQTLKCDFHIHTVFSDGDVWPTIRVQEAYYEGLDAIAITDHIEFRPHFKDISANHNRSYEIAKPEAEKFNILLVKAAEITREMPPGHLNALFVDDLTKLDVPNYMDAIQEANNQGAFIFWNHPGWDAQQPDTTKWWDVHEKIYENGWLQGIEVYNWDEYYPIAFDWCNEKKLAYIANSDIHIVNSHRFRLREFHRPMTLVFAHDKSLPALKSALFEKRSVAFFGDEMAGPEALLSELFYASVKVNKPFNIVNGKAFFEIDNPTDLTFILENEYPLDGAPAKIEIFPGSSVIVKCNLDNGRALLPYSVTNLFTGKTTKLKVELKIILK